MWKNMVEADIPQMTIWRMRVACWITKATQTHTHTHTQNMQYIVISHGERASMLPSTYIHTLPVTLFLTHYDMTQATQPVIRKSQGLCSYVN